MNVSQTLLPSSGAVRMTDKKHILIVEDEERISKIYKSFLQVKDYYISDVLDGREALAFLQRIQVDLIITDIAMARLGGIELIEKVKEMGIIAPIIVVSAAYHHEELSLRSGAAVFLAKPILPSQLLEVVEKLLNDNR